MSAPTIFRLPFTKDQVEAELSTRSMRHFVRNAWPIVEPTKAFLPSWHIDAVCDHLQAVTEKKIQNLIILLPPGHAKSLCVSVLWQPWTWLPKNRPDWRALFCSYDGVLSLRDNVRCRTLLEDSWYKNTFNIDWTLQGDQNVKSYYQNSATGFRIALSVGGKGTGFRGNCVVVDDPLNAKDQYSDSALSRVTFWWDQVMSNRLNDLSQDARVIIMQRLSTRDLVGHVKAYDDYTVLSLPTKYEVAEKCRTFVQGNLFFEDPRNTNGELLFPKLFPQHVIDTEERRLGPDGFAAQHQQRPTRMGGGLLARKNWNFWKPRDTNTLPPVRVQIEDGSYIEKQAVELPEKFDGILDSWDCAFKDEPTSDYVVGGKIAWDGPKRFILTLTRDRLDLDRTIKAMTAMRDWNLYTNGVHTQEICIEDKANGTAAIKAMRKSVSAVTAVNPEDGKYSRASASQPEQVAGDWYLPHPDIFPWVNEFISECADFPNGAHDDQVDFWSQGAGEVRKKWNGLMAYLQDQLNSKPGEKKMAQAAIAADDKLSKFASLGIGV